MKAYPAYTPAGEDWLGQAPTHWQRATVRAITRPFSEKGRPDLPLLSVYRDYGVVQRTEEDENHNVIPEDLTNYKVVCPGQLVLNKMKSWQGSLGVSEFEGIVSPAYIVCALRGAHNPRFVHYLLRSNPYVFAWKRISYGVRCDQWDMRYADFKQTPIFLPPRAEQDAIVAFLEAKDQDIQTFIANKRRMIELLKEQKTTLINRAVTRGLNPNVPLKPSGIPWIGCIPKHWHEKPAKFFFREIDERSQVGREELLSVSHITGVTPRREKEITMFMAESYEGFKMCQPGDLVINIMWAWMGALGVSRHSGIVSSAYGVYRLKDPATFEFDYLDHLLRAKPYTADYHCRSTGIRSSRLRMYTDDFFKVPILRPPVPEQRQIAEYVRAESAQTDGVVATAERQIAFMEEYRAALIAAAVTGKIDVRRNAENHSIPA